MTLPEATRASFWLGGWAWQLPDYENADTFVAWLVRAALLVIDHAVPAAPRNELTDASLRTVQRRFLQATGVTQSGARQIERARYAALLLKRGESIADATHVAGYFDQPHLTRSLKRLIGQTPAELSALAPSCRICTRRSRSPRRSFSSCAEKQYEPPYITRTVCRLPSTASGRGSS